MKRVRLKPVRMWWKRDTCNHRPRSIKRQDTCKRKREVGHGNFHRLAAGCCLKVSSVHVSLPSGSLRPALPPSLELCANQPGRKQKRHQSSLSYNHTRVGALLEVLPAACAGLYEVRRGKPTMPPPPSYGAIAQASAVPRRAGWRSRRSAFAAAALLAVAVVTLLAVAAERPAPGTTVLWGIFGKLARHVHHLVNKGIDHARKQAEEAQQKLQAQARMLAERANQRRIAQEEAARRRAEEEAARRQAEADRKRQEEEQRQREEEARRKAEEEARAQRLAAQERARAEAAAKAAAEAAAAKEQLYRLNA